jgi:hypothetical protein
VLVAAAAREWKVDPARCRTEAGYVIDDRGRRRPYSELLEAASALPAPKDAPLKDSRHFRIVGKFENFLCARERFGHLFDFAVFHHDLFQRAMLFHRFGIRLHIRHNIGRRNLRGQILVIFFDLCKFFQHIFIVLSSAQAAENLVHFKFVKLTVKS